MTLPKLKPCATCKTDEYLGIYKYDHGGQHVECNLCYYMGPLSTSKLRAVRLHNDAVTAAAEKSP